MTSADELFEAIALGNAGRVEELVSREPELLAVRDSLGDTPLHAAVEHDQADILRRLLELKADPHARDALGRTPLAALRERAAENEIHDHEEAAGPSPAVEARRDMAARLSRAGGSD